MSNLAANRDSPTIIRTRNLSAEMRSRFEMLETDIQKGLVPAWVFGNDPELYTLERERLFPRAWTFVGHESEIPNRGDHLLRYIGEDSFILVRGADDHVRLLFNACRHRGSQVCAVERGNSEKFQCPYHGWTYDNTGNFIGAPSQGDAIGANGACMRRPGLDFIAASILPVSITPHRPSPIILAMRLIISIYFLLSLMISKSSARRSAICGQQIGKPVLTASATTII